MGRLENVDSSAPEHDDVPPLFRSALRDDWAARIQDTISLGDYEKAAVLLREAEREFGSDPVIPSLQIACLKLADRKARFEAALQAAEHELCDDRFAASLGKFREAVTLSRGYLRLSQKACDEGLEAAWKTVKSHWRFARQMVMEVQSVGVPPPVPASILAAIDEQKREESIRIALDESGRADHTAYLPHVRQRIAALAAIYPDCEPLQSRLQVLDRQLAGRVAEERDKNLQRLLLFRDRLDQTENPKALRSFWQLVTPFVSHYQDDPEFAAVLADMSRLRSRYESALDLLNRNDLSSALDVCNEVLERRPANLLFSAVEEKAKAKQWRNKLVQSIVDRARQLEESSHYGAALEEWESIRQIEPNFPGLESEILHCAALQHQTESLQPSETAPTLENALVPEIVIAQPAVETTALTLADSVAEPEEFQARPYAFAPELHRKVRIIITAEAWNNLKTGVAATLAVLLVVLMIAVR